MASGAEVFDVAVIGLGALGSATAHQLAARGLSVVGLEQFRLGHDRGASHDTSRILRHSYHTPQYVGLTIEAYDDWAALEEAAGESFVTVVGGLDLFPPEPAIAPDDYVASLAALGIEHELLSVAQVAERWPQFRLPAGTMALYQARGAIVPAARGTAAMQRLAGAAGARLLDEVAVTSVTAIGGGYRVSAGDASYDVGRVVVCADAWTNRVLAGLGVSIPLTTTLEQVTYFGPADPSMFGPAMLPLWIWMDDPSFYGFPCYGEATVKAAQDCGGPPVNPDARGFDPDPAMRDRLAAHMARMLPGVGGPVRSGRCQYTLTPDRDFVISPVPGHEGVVVGLGAAHGFKFAPTFGRILAALTIDGHTSSDIAGFAFDRPGLADPDFRPTWLV